MELTKINGVPPPQTVYTMPNSSNMEFLSEVHVSKYFGLSLTSKGIVHVHHMPDFSIVSSKQISAVVTLFVKDANHFVVLHTTRPIVFDTEYGVTTGTIKRPNFQSTDRYQFVTSSYHDDLLVAGTSNSSLCLWDLRSSSAPHLLRFKRSFNIESVTMSADIIILGCQNGTISILDPRNMTRKLNTFDAFSSLSTKITKPHYSIIHSTDDPWVVGFQFSCGFSGILDIMSQRVTHVIEAPTVITSDQRHTKPRPVFSGSSMCVGYPFTNVLQCFNTADNDLRHIELPTPPTSVDCCPDFDGIYAVSASGDAYHVF